MTRVAVRRQVLRQDADCRALVDLLCQTFIEHGCDGLFLPAVSNLGVRLPIREIVQAIGSRAELRFVALDGAQSLAHVPLELDRNYCDLLLAGCHKWLRAYNPLGVAFYGHPRSTQYIHDTVQRLMASRRIDDPLADHDAATRQRPNVSLRRNREPVTPVHLSGCCRRLPERPR